MGRKVVIVSGPTATGKTRLSIDLAERFNGTVVNFDSLLFYKGIEIGTAKPTANELQRVPHRLINIAHPQDSLNASDFVQLAKNTIEDLLVQNEFPILTGGSAFYLRALIKGMYESVSADPETRDRVENLYSNKGVEGILDYLKRNDPSALEFIHINDLYRLKRAVEHHMMTHTSISNQRKNFQLIDPYDFSQNLNVNWDICHIYLDIEKSKHWEIISRRAREMIEKGLINEVKEALAASVPPDSTLLRSIGPKQAYLYLTGKIKTTEELHQQIFFATRRLAKSQRTFFKKIHPKVTFDPLTDQLPIFELVEKFLKSI